MDFNDQRLASSFASIPKLICVYKAGRDYTRMPRAMHMHSHQAEIVFIRTGSGLHTIGEKQYKTCKGDILIYNSGVIHDECSSLEADLSTYCCAVSELQLRGLPPNKLIADDRQPVLKAGVRFNELENLFEMLYSYMQNNSGANRELTGYLLRALLLIVLTKIEQNSQPLVQEAKITALRIKKYIDEHYLEDINLLTIAKNLKINQYYLSHVFKELAGYSPMQYLIRRRIGEAQSLLINTDCGVTEIAMRVGYNNSNHFHGAFVKMVGMAPGRYRKYVNTNVESNSIRVETK